MTGKKILVLGSGMVAKPCVDYLLRREENLITVACRTLSTAQKLADGRSRVTAVSLDVASPQVESAIAEHDLVISLVPFIYHADVARLAIKNQTQVVTTSYVSPAIKELDGPAKAAGITILNEVGVDPGVDHCYAVKVIGEVHEKGGKIREFYSYCGGLPAPEASNNPLKFKFSWSPRGALLSQHNAAIFLKDGNVVEIPNNQVMANAVPYHVVDGYSFLAYPNRNSVPFREFYQIPEAQTVIRGSLRYDGNPQLVKALIDLGWINTDPQEWLSPGMTWAQIQMKATAASSTSETDLLEKVKELCHFQSPEEQENIISGLRWIGLFSSQQAPVKGNLLDTLSAHLDDVCKFGPDERDLVMLQHKFVVDWPNGTTDTITSTMELLGEPGGYSAMSKSVGITCGIATQLLLDGHPAIRKPGIVAPYNKDICDALRERFEPEGIKLFEKTL
ncbi:saccharopine dehydrogenase [Xylaria sp. FL1777]|nr:saccharopine dehydrogenase [Xylaria sp. FL1777]